MVLDLTAVQIVLDGTERALAVAAILMETASGIVLARRSAEKMTAVRSSAKPYPPAFRFFSLTGPICRPSPIRCRVWAGCCHRTYTLSR